jgi:molybdenum cofactor guanylyltransferase
MHSPHTIGLVLAGGRSRRMQGQDKTLLVLQGEPLLAHVIRRLGPQVDSLALNSNATPDTFAAYGLPVIPDRLPGFLGPLAGIHAGLMQYPEATLVTVAVDLPFLPPDLVSRLRAGLGTKPCAYASDTERRPPWMAEMRETQEQFSRHALALLWRPGTAASVEEYLKRGGRSLKEFLAEHGQAVRFGQPQDRGLFCNLNTPEDLARAEHDVDLLVIPSAADEHR